MRFHTQYHHIQHPQINVQRNDNDDGDNSCWCNWNYKALHWALIIIYMEFSDCSEKYHKMHPLVPNIRDARIRFKYYIVIDALHEVLRTNNVNLSQHKIYYKFWKSSFSFASYSSLHTMAWFDLHIPQKCHVCYHRKSFENIFHPDTFYSMFVCGTHSRGKNVECRHSSWLKQQFIWIFPL